MADRFLLEQRLSGSSPERLLFETSRFPSWECFPSSGGRAPESLLLNSRMSTRFSSNPMFSGIDPWNWLL
uniref:Uncharacterized protein n=1 Tax=Arundo donax TaxID=35708 RepID=A0A0A9BIQ3_ARUDO